MRTSTIKIGRLAPIISGQISPEIAIQVLREGRFSHEEIKLVNILIDILEAGEKISSENIWTFSSSKDALLLYMDYLDEIDKKTITQ